MVYSKVQQMLDEGWYTPQSFRGKGAFMSSGQEKEDQEAIRADWDALHGKYYRDIDAFSQKHALSKEQVNRLLPSTRMITGVLTATTPAWEAVLALRLPSENSSPDVATAEFFGFIHSALLNANWNISDRHLPYDSGNGIIETAARIARVSTGAPGPGKRSDWELGLSLLSQRHLSPFEHIARWEENPLPSAACSKEEDRGTAGGGWTTARAVYERNGNDGLSSGF